MDTAQDRDPHPDAVVAGGGIVGAAAALGLLARGTRVLVRVQGMDLLTLDLHASMVQRLDDEQSAEPVDAADEDDELEQSSAPLALAIDVADAADGAEAQDSPA